MKYIDRDKDGNIIAIYACKQRSGQEKIAKYSAEITDFEKKQKPKKVWSSKEQFQYMYENGFDDWKIEYEKRLAKNVK